MKNYTVRRASMSDMDLIMCFINEYWSAGHILAKSKTVFEWQYRDGALLNFIVACDHASNQILAVLGFIKYGPTFSDDIMLALWKSIAADNPFLGVELLDYLENTLNAKRISCNGINLKTTKLIYEFKGYHIDSLQHYYRLADSEVYHIAKINNKYILPCLNERTYELISIDTFDQFVSIFQFSHYENQNLYPKKGKEFLKHRYFEHPIYQYQVYGIRNKQGAVNSFLFMRPVPCLGTKVLRIVDFIGNIEDLSHISYEINQLLYSGGYEYIDFLQNGISDDVMKQAGFLLNDDNSDNIIPNYFEPYECKNVKVWFATKYENNFIIFKADGDQDRPNRI